MLKLRKNFRHGGFVLALREGSKMFEFQEAFGESMDSHQVRGEDFAEKLNDKLFEILEIQEYLQFEHLEDAIELALQELFREIGYVEIIHDNPELPIELELEAENK